MWKNYRVVWVEKGKKKKEDFEGFEARERAQDRASDLRKEGYAACVEEATW